MPTGGFKKGLILKILYQEFQLPVDIFLELQLYRHDFFSL